MVLPGQMTVLEGDMDTCLKLGRSVREWRTDLPLTARRETWLWREYRRVKIERDKRQAFFDAAARRHAEMQNRVGGDGRWAHRA